MRSLIFAFSVIVFLGVSGTSAMAGQGPKPWVFGWWPGHWKDLNFEQPYLYEGKIPHNTQWDYRSWQPKDWIAQREDGLKLIEGWYISGIISDQYMKKEVPVLEVGPAFYDLGGLDKKRVMQTVDAVYEITGNKENGIFRIRDYKSGNYIGLYSRHGLMLQ